MKFWSVVALAGALSLAACGGSKDAPAEGEGEGAAQGDQAAAVKSACAKFELDEQAVTAITGTGATMSDFCDCLAVRVTANADKSAGWVTALETVTAGMDATTSTDEVVSEIEGRADADDATDAEKALAADVRELGDIIEGTLGGMEANGGACPAD